jgi:ppGpp synthetase/RelA/SpoT-type nucleotidyltranferase
MEWTKSQVDRLGERLRKGDISEADLRLLDSYRRSFSDAYKNVIGRIREQLNLEPTGRPAKSTTSVIDKLQRESIRLSQMQDIAGCRLTVENITAQDEVVAQLTTLFEKVTIVDRRQHPSHGYRAVHVVVEHSGKLIEVQARTSLQHLWAELSEKFSDVVDPAIKYGAGDGEAVAWLAKMSQLIAGAESAEERFVAQLLKLSQQDTLPENTKQLIDAVQEGFYRTKRLAIERLEKTRDEIDLDKGD